MGEDKPCGCARRLNFAEGHPAEPTLRKPHLKLDAPSLRLRSNSGSQLAQNSDVRQREQNRRRRQAPTELSPAVSGRMSQRPDDQATVGRESAGRNLLGPYRLTRIRGRELRERERERSWV